MMKLDLIAGNTFTPQKEGGPPPNVRCPPLGGWYLYNEITSLLS